jgi:hypothetical protein
MLFSAKKIAIERSQAGTEEISGAMKIASK